MSDIRTNSLSKECFPAYLKAGGKPENLYQSIKRQHPLAGMPLHMRQQFLTSLSAQDRDNIKLAVDWYKQAYR